MLPDGRPTKAVSDPTELRSPRFAELDAQIQAQAEQRRNRPQRSRKRKPGSRSEAGMPAAVRKEITRGQPEN